MIVQTSRHILLTAALAVACGSPPGSTAAGPISVSPASAQVPASGTAQFTAAATTGTAAAVSWSVQEGTQGGAVSTSGLYTAPTALGTYHVVATSQLDATKSATAAVTVATSAATSYWVTGYWADWNVGPGTSSLHLDYTKIDWSALTHLVVANVGINSSTQTISYNGGMLSPTLAKQITAAAHAHGVKAILMIGGAGTAQAWADAVGSTFTSAQKFAQNIYDVAHADGFDGIDIDWETVGGSSYGGSYTASSGAMTGDHQRFKWIAQALRALWPDMIITAALGWGWDTPWYGSLKDGAFVSQSAGWSGNWLINQFNVMTYDAANGWPGWESWFHNALADDLQVGSGGETKDWWGNSAPSGNSPQYRPSSIASSLAIVAKYVPKTMIGMGLPFYGSAWTKAGGAWAPRQMIAVDYNAASQGMDTTWTYKFIMDNYYKPYDGADPTDTAGRTHPDGIHTGYIFDAKAGVGYITGGSAGYARNGQTPVRWVSFETVDSINAKCTWLKSNGYGGTIIWLINEGVTDISTTPATNPLLSAVKANLLP